ncbi:MAG: hypothetical protein ACXWC9_02020 [Pseudobdellovibrionaceae bacterium]
MKIMSLASALLSLVVVQSAQASYFQINCSNADHTVATASGHSKNSVTLTEYSYGDNGPVYKSVELDAFNVNNEGLKTTQLHEERKGGCVPGQSTGFMSYKSVSYHQVRIQMTDGSLFSKNIIGVSQDLKSIEAFLICEQEVNNMIGCPGTKK